MVDVTYIIQYCEIMYSIVEWCTIISNKAKYVLVYYTTGLENTFRMTILYSILFYKVKIKPCLDAISILFNACLKALSSSGPKIIPHSHGNFILITNHLSWSLKDQSTQFWGEASLQNSTGAIQNHKQIVCSQSRKAPMTNKKQRKGLAVDCGLHCEAIHLKKLLVLDIVQREGCIRLDHNIYDNK